MDFIKSLNLLNERYLNLFTPEEKKPYVDEVWDLIQNAYAYAGGIKGGGFESKEAMIEKIPFWKLVKKDNKIVAVRLYKDKAGRKSVASATDKSELGSEFYKKISKDDLKRSWVEVSDKALQSLKKSLGDSFFDYAIPVDIVKQKLPDDDIQPIDDYYYKRKIGNDWITKIALGNPNAKKIQ